MAAQNAKKVGRAKAACGCSGKVKGGKVKNVGRVAATAGCCSTNVKNQIVCLNIPTKANLVLLGIPLTLQVKCLSIASKRKLTNAEIQMISKRLGTLLAGLLGGGLGG